jgi:molybdopterin-guanine dinucleotide biosynthesis protein A
MIDNRAEPMAAIYPRDAHHEMASALSGNDFSLQSVIQKLIAAGRMRPLEVAPAEQSFFRNLNEPQDL